MERLSARLFPGRGVFAVLTYPGNYERDPATWKAHLYAIRRRWERRWGPTSGAWSMEFQRRGAVHFNLALTIPTDVDLDAIRRWLAVAWYEIVASGDPRHLDAGTSCDEITEEGGLGRYLCREIGKWQQKVLPDYVSATGAGRWWGVWRAADESVEIPLTPREFVSARRVLRSLARRKRYNFRPRSYAQGLLVFDDSRVAWSLAIHLLTWLRSSSLTVDPLRTRSQRVPPAPGHERRRPQAETLPRA